MRKSVLLFLLLLASTYINCLGQPIKDSFTGDYRMEFNPLGTICETLPLDHPCHGILNADDCNTCMAGLEVPINSHIEGLIFLGLLLGMLHIGIKQIIIRRRFA